MTYELKIEEPTFEDLRLMFNKMLMKVLKKMEETETNVGTLGLKMTINLEEDFDEDGNFIKRPVFAYEVSTEYKEKYKLENKIFGQYQLTFNENLDCYEMADIPTRQQTIY